MSWVLAYPPQGKDLHGRGQQRPQQLNQAGLGRCRVGSYSLVIHPGGGQHERLRVFGLLEEVVVQAAGLLAHQIHEFEQESPHLRAVLQLTLNSDEQVAFGGCSGRRH